MAEGGNSDQYHEVLANQLMEAMGRTGDLPADVTTLLQKVSKTYTLLYDELKRSEATVALRTEQLIASTSRAYSFLDSLNMGFIMFDTGGEVVLTNHSVQAMLSPNAEQAHWTLATIDELLGSQVNLKDLVQQVLGAGGSIEQEVNAGNRALHMFFAPMAASQDGPGRAEQIGVIILVEDITDQRALERSKDEFLSLASHELRTPLTAIRGNTFLIKKYYGEKLPPETVEMIDDVHESSVRLIDIVNDFLSVSALEQGRIALRPEPILLDETIDQVLHELKQLSDPKGLTLSYQHDDPLPEIVADAQRIKQVLINLVSNAIKYTDSGGITLSSRADDKYVYVLVSDTGKGIPPENQSLLFRKFQQASDSPLTRDSTKSTGLGLYISKLIIELSGGQIKLVRSEPGKGSVFAFSLPRVL
jgi:signal transduction histidine kinase